MFFSLGHLEEDGPVKMFQNVAWEEQGREAGLHGCAKAG
jgi:hypothetical protein